MRVLKWTALFVAVVVIAGVLFILFGLNTLRGPISRAVTNATGRELLIERLEPVWDWVHPRFRAEGVSFANPDWAKEKHLLKADAVEMSMSVLPLLTGRVVVPEVHLEKPVVALEQDAEGRKTWILKEKQDQKEESRFHIHRLTLDHGQLSYDDAPRAINLRAELSTDATGVGFTLNGKYNGLPATASGHGGPVLALRDDNNSAYPLKAEAKIGNTGAKVDGNITGLVGLTGLDMQIELSGKSMEELYDIIGVVLPSTSAYRTAGHLIREGKFVRYENFTGKVGESDLSGTFQFDTGGQKPAMSADLTSKLLNLADLGPLVGTQQPRKAGVLPDAPFDPKRWQAMNADVKIKAGTIKRPEQLPIERLSSHIKMQDAVLTLDPLEFGVAGGRLAGPIRLDGRQETIKGNAKIQVDKLQLSKMFPTLKVAQASVGDLSGAIELNGAGNSVARMLGTSNGKIGLYMNGGEVREALMQLAAINVWGFTRAKLKGDRQIPIRCVVGDFGVKDGVMQTNALVFDTEVVVVTGEGSINLKSEELNLTLRPQPKELSLASLRSPLYIRGTFSKPDVGVDVPTIAAKGAGAVVMGILNPLLALIPLIDGGPGKDSPCGQLIAEMTSKTRNVRDAATASSSQSASSGETVKRPPEKSAR
jgi:uncharacterized protein involved in outer membrane biogenesis